MTNEDAIEIIKTFRVAMDSPITNYRDILLGAFDMAIDALKEQRPQSEWVITVDNYPNPHYPTTSYTCPFCNSTFYWGYQYCCICGAKMANGMDYKIERGIKE